MRLLIVTQAVDANDQALGFFIQWITELSTRVEKINVICLKKGEYNVPKNVLVHSLGKEDNVNRIEYVRRFYSYIWKFRHDYDAVFVHMNEEYVLLGGFLWKLLGKSLSLWRNHYAGSFRTDLAAFLCTKIFCTSKHSYTARYRKTIRMPVGVDLRMFADSEKAHRELNSILFLARIAPSKRPEMFIDALGEVLARGIPFTASIYGSPLPEDAYYYESLKTRAEALGLHDRLRFHTGVPHDATADVYRSHDIFVNCSPSGMFDKTLFEAAACGCRVIASSDDFKDAAGEESYAPDTQTLVERLIKTLEQSGDVIERSRIRMQALARSESQGTLGDLLSQELNSSTLEL